MAHSPLGPGGPSDDETALPGPTRPEEAELQRQLKADAALVHLVRCSGPDSPVYRTVAHALDESLVGLLLRHLRAGALGRAIAQSIGIDLGVIAATRKNVVLASDVAALSVCLFMNSHLMGRSWRPEDRHTLRAALEPIGLVKYAELHVIHVAGEMTVSETGQAAPADLRLFAELRPWTT